MWSRLVISVVCTQLTWSYGYPASATASEGVGAYAYQDSSGNRYGGTYGLKDGQAYNFNGPQEVQPYNFNGPMEIQPFGFNGNEDFTTFGPNPFPDFQDLDSFFPEYFRNFENLLHEAVSTRRTLQPSFGGSFFGRRSSGRAFAKNLEQQKIALEAARKAFDLTSNQAGYIPNSGFDSRFGGAPNFGFQNFGMPNFGNNNRQGLHTNSAFAGGAVGPGFRHQMVNINPMNPRMPNTDVSKFSDDTGRGGGVNGKGQYFSVSSSSYSSSSNKDGKESSVRGGETIVNDNGKVTKYSLHS